MSKRDLTQGSIYKHIIAISLPMMIGLIAHMFLNLSDAIYVTRLGINESQAVLNYSFPMFYIPFAIFNGLNIGITAILAQKIGANLKEEAQNILAQCMIISIAIFAFYFIFFTPILELYFGLFQVDEIVKSLSTDYLKILIYGIFLVSLSLVLGGALKAEGNVKILMKAMMYGTLVNLIVDPFLIFESFRFAWIEWSGFGFGVKGAAWATLISDVVIFTIIFLFFLKQDSHFRWPVLPHWRNMSGLVSVFKISLPAMISQAVLAMNLSFLTFLLKPYGVESISALGISVRLDIIAIFPALSITTAVISLVGQNYGAENLGRIQESAKKCLIVGFFSLLVLGMFINILKVPIIGLFNPIDGVQEKVNYYLSVMTLSYGFIALSMISGGIFQGLGQGLHAMMFTLIRSLILTFTLAWIFSSYLGLEEYGIYNAPALSNTLMGLIALSFVYKALRKLRIKLKTEK